MPEVIAITNPDTDIKDVILHSDLSELDSAIVNQTMAACIASRLANNPITGSGYGLVEMDDGRLVKSPYYIGFSKQQGGK